MPRQDELEHENKIQGIEELRQRTAALVIVHQLRYEFLIDISYCNAVEEIFLKLAGIKEMPVGNCMFGNDLDIVKEDQLEQKHSKQNSIFFQFTLSDSKSIEKLKTFTRDNEIEFHDYTSTIQGTGLKSNDKLIRIDARGARNILLPKIKAFLRKNPVILKNYLEITRQALSKEIGSVDDHDGQDELRQRINKINDRIKILDSIRTSTWCNLFCNRKTAIIATTAITGVTLALTFSRVMK